MSNVEQGMSNDEVKKNVSFMLGHKMNIIYRKTTITCKLILLSLLCFGIVEKSQACDCGPPPSPTKTLAYSDAVFTGTVTGRRHSKYGYLFEFRVEKAWKGVSQLHVLVETSPDGGSCGYAFEIGKSYIVYARYETKNLYTDICTRTNLLASASVDIKELGTPIASQQDLIANPRSILPAILQSNINFWWLLSISVALLLWFLVRKQIFRRPPTSDIQADAEEETS